MSITAIVENGMIKLPVHVPDGTKVEIVLPEEKPTTGAKTNPHTWMLKYAGCINTLPADAAERHDEYQRERIQRQSS